MPNKKITLYFDFASLACYNVVAMECAKIDKYLSGPTSQYTWQDIAAIKKRVKRNRELIAKHRAALHEAMKKLVITIPLEHDAADKAFHIFLYKPQRSKKPKDFTDMILDMARFYDGRRKARKMAYHRDYRCERKHQYQFV